MSENQQSHVSGVTAAGDGRFAYTIDPRDEHLGAGYRLKLMDNGEEVGGGVYPVTDETTDEDAYADAFSDGEAWLQSLASPIETEGAKTLQDAMIDIETLGKKPGAAVLSIGAVMFGATGLGATFYEPVSLQSCTDVGLTIDSQTVAWWMKQSDEARAAAFVADAPSLPIVLQRFTDWFVEQKARYPWCHGATFDVPILDSAYEACGLPTPWKFYDVRDTRTLYDLVGVKVDRSNGTHHNALDDARAQAEAAAAAFRRLSRLEQLEDENKDLRDQLDAAYNSLDRTGEWVRELEAKNAITQQADWKAAAECLQEEVKQLRDVVATAAAGLTPTDEQVKDEQTKFETAIRAIFGFSDRDFEKDEKGYKYAATLDMWNGWTAYADRRLHETFEDYLRLLARMSNAARDVLAERRRQVEQEGWTPAHDDQHGDCSMSYAAACYALAGTPVARTPMVSIQRLWEYTGWSWLAWWKPKDRRRNLVRAGALILAEIERLDRAALSASQSAAENAEGKSVIFHEKSLSEE